MGLATAGAGAATAGEAAAGTGSGIAASGAGSAETSAAGSADEFGLQGGRTKMRGLRDSTGPSRAVANWVNQRATVQATEDAGDIRRFKRMPRQNESEDANSPSSSAVGSPVLDLGFALLSAFASAAATAGAAAGAGPSAGAGVAAAAATGVGAGAEAATAGAGEGAAVTGEVLELEVAGAVA
ncbi:hypothetical protein FOCC_FOCC005963 [Frankliniella occidentalis]|nr:hypothetical protein FOCC_FOCC005963 [Frankliniella occidentalis]